jgi:hypothetical protein
MNKEKNFIKEVPHERPLQTKTSLKRFPMRDHYKQKYE